MCRLFFKGIVTVLLTGCLFLMPEMGDSLAAQPDHPRHETPGCQEAACLATFSSPVPTVNPDWILPAAVTFSPVTPAPPAPGFLTTRRIDVTTVFSDRVGRYLRYHVLLL